MAEAKGIRTNHVAGTPRAAKTSQTILRAKESIRRRPWMGDE